VRYGDRVSDLDTPDGLSRSKLAQALARCGTPDGVIATTRSWNTVAKLVELTGGRVKKPAFSAATRLQQVPPSRRHNIAGARTISANPLRGFPAPQWGPHASCMRTRTPRCHERTSSKPPAGWAEFHAHAAPCAVDLAEFWMSAVRWLTGASVGNVQVS